MQNQQRMAKQTGNAPTIAEYGATLVLEKQRELLRNIRNLDMEQGEKVLEERELTIESRNPCRFLSSFCQYLCKQRFDRYICKRKVREVSQRSFFATHSENCF